MTDREYLKKLSGTMWADLDHDRIFTIDELYELFKELQHDDPNEYPEDYTFIHYMEAIKPRNNGCVEQCFYVDNAALQELVDGDLYVTSDGTYFHKYPDNQFYLNHYGASNGCLIGDIDDLKEGAI